MMYITLNECWDIDVIVPFEGQECLWLASKGAYEWKKRKVIDVKTEKRMMLLRYIQSTKAFINAETRHLCLPISAKGHLNCESNSLKLIRFMIYGEKAFFLYDGDDKQLEKNLIGYLLTRNFEFSFVEMHINKDGDLENILDKNKNRISLAVAEVILECPGTMYNPVTFYDERNRLNYFMQGVEKKIQGQGDSCVVVTLTELLNDVWTTYKERLDDGTYRTYTDCNIFKRNEDHKYFIIEDYEEMEEDEIYATMMEMRKVYEKLVEDAVRTLPRTNRKARLFIEYVLKNLELISYFQNEVTIPNSSEEFFEGIKEVEVVKVNYEWRDFSFLHVYSKYNEKIKSSLNDKQANGILTYQILNVRLE